MLGDDQVQDTCEKLEARFESLTVEEAAAEQPPAVLHHYTSSEGLLGIIQTREIWATNVLCLNDASELSHATQILQDELESALDVEEYDDLFSMELPGYAKEVPLDHFVLSFCEDGDLLSQWRGYGAPGTGYSIGFSTTALRSAAMAAESNGPGICILRKVMYDPDQKTEMIRKRVTILNEILEPIKDELEQMDWGDPRREQLLSRVGATFRPTLALMKHDAFNEEKEWRLVRTLSKSRDPTAAWPVKVRTIRGRLAPYVPISWPLRTAGLMRDRLSIKELCCGPSANPELEEKAVRDLLDGQDCSEAQVNRSQVPLRA